jgi:hypothetical protein
MVLYNSNANSYGLYIGAGSGTNHALYITDSTRTSNLFKVQGDGKVGIGTASPQQHLHIAGTDSTGVLVTGGTNNRKVSLSGSSLNFYTANNGYAMGGYMLKGSDGAVLAQMFGAYGGSDNIAYLYYGGTAYNSATMYINGSNVGIGYSNPLCRLHIGPEGSVGGNTPTMLISSAAGTKPAILITEYTARSGAFGYDSSNFLTLATEASVTAGIKLKVGSSFQSGLLNTGTDALVINGSGQVQRPSQPSFLAFSTGFTVTAGAWYNISNAMTSEQYDVANNYSSGRFTAPVAGRYLFYFGGYSTIASNGDRYAVAFTINGGGQFYISGSNYCIADTPLNGVSIIYNLAANDYVEMSAFSAVGGTWGAGYHGVWWGGYLL